MNKNEFIEELSKINITLSEEQLNKLEKYYELLVFWNEKINLTSITEKEEVYLKHFYDSLTLSKVINLDDNLILCDIGTGAGFPGLVLKICFPKLNITLVDSLEKRIKFLNLVIDELDLENIKAIHTRAEDFAKENIEKFDIVTSRAVAKLNILNELSIPILKVGGYFLPMKANIDGELEQSSNSIKLLNSKLIDVIEFKLPKENSVRNIIKIEKIGITNTKYPRKFDKIKRNPL